MPRSTAHKTAGKTTIQKPAASSTVTTVPESSAEIEKEPMVATLEREKVVVEKRPFAPEDDDYVCVILPNWSALDPTTRQPLIRPDQVTWLDKTQFTGGVARNVPYALAKRWAKLGMISKDHIFPNTAQADVFKTATGRDLMSAQDLATAVQTLSPAKAAALLGKEAGMKFAKELQKFLASQPEDND